MLKTKATFNSWFAVIVVPIALLSWYSWPERGNYMLLDMQFRMLRLNTPKTLEHDVLVVVKVACVDF